MPTSSSTIDTEQSSIEDLLGAMAVNSSTHVQAVGSKLQKAATMIPQ
jgi:hypothetical protein